MFSEMLLRRFNAQPLLRKCLASRMLHKFAGRPQNHENCGRNVDEEAKKDRINKADNMVSLVDRS